MVGKVCVLVFSTDGLLHHGVPTGITVYHFQLCGYIYIVCRNQLHPSVEMDCHGLFRLCFDNWRMLFPMLRAGTNYHTPTGQEITQMRVPCATLTKLSRISILNNMINLKFELKCHRVCKLTCLVFMENVQCNNVTFLGLWLYLVLAHRSLYIILRMIYSNYF